MTVLHRLQEDVFQRIALIIQAAYLHFVFCCQAIQITNLNSILQDHFHSLIARQCVLTTKRTYRFGKSVLITTGLQNQELAIGLTFLLQITVDNKSSFLKNYYLLTTFLHIPQEVRRKDYVGLTAIANLLYQSNHSLTCGRIETVSRFVQKDQPRTMN